MTARSRDFEVKRLMQLSEEVRRIASSLAELSPDGSNSEFQRGAGSVRPDISEEIVTGLIRARRYRTRYLPPELFADPAWDILLDLLHAEIVGRRVSVSRLSTVSELPATTGLRWIDMMVDQGLLIRKPDPDDGRRVFVELVSEVSDALRRYFLDVVQTYRTPVDVNSAN